MLGNVWDEIVYPSTSFNGCTAEVWEWIGNFTSHFTMDIITYSCWDLSWAMLVKEAPGVVLTEKIFWLSITLYHPSKWDNTCHSNARRNRAKLHGILMVNSSLLVIHICVSELFSIGSGYGVSPDQCQAITWTNADLLSIGPFGTNLNEIRLKIHAPFHSRKWIFKMSSAKWRPFYPGIWVNVR